MRALLLFSLLAVAVPDRPDRSPKEAKPQDPILGDWGSVQVGAKASWVWRFTPSEALWLENGTVSPQNGFTATYTIDWTKNPVAIDLMPRRGGEKLLGILKLEGDRLTIGLGATGARPTDFGPNVSSQHFARIKN